MRPRSDDAPTAPRLIAEEPTQPRLRTLADEPTAPRPPPARPIADDPTAPRPLPPTPREAFSRPATPAPPPRFGEPSPPVHRTPAAPQPHRAPQPTAEPRGSRLPFVLGGLAGTLLVVSVLGAAVWFAPTDAPLTDVPARLSATMGALQALLDPAPPAGIEPARQGE